MEWLIENNLHFGNSCYSNMWSWKKYSSYSNIVLIFGPRGEKTRLWGFQQGEIQASLLSYID